MARIYLPEEIKERVRNAIKLAENALKDIDNAETTVEAMLRSNEMPDEISLYGGVRYKLAGLQLLQAIEEIELLNIDPTEGLKFPEIIDLRTAENAAENKKALVSYATVGNMSKEVDPHIDANDENTGIYDSAGNRLTIIAKPVNLSQDRPNPFGVVGSGETYQPTFRITKSSTLSSKVAVAGELVGLEGKVLTQTNTQHAPDIYYTNMATMRNEADEPGDLTIVGMDEVPWRDGDYFLRLDINLKTVFGITDANNINTDPLGAGDPAKLDMACDTLQLRMVDDGT
jgi:hypothetical protein